MPLRAQRIDVPEHMMPRFGGTMVYIKVVLSALAAIFIAESVLLWRFLSPVKATGVAVVRLVLLESLLSLKFWIVCVLAFGLFFAASRATTVLRVLFFWIPTVSVSAVGLAIVGFYTYVYFYVISKLPQIH